MIVYHLLEGFQQNCESQKIGVQKNIYRKKTCCGYFPYSDFEQETVKNAAKIIRPGCQMCVFVSSTQNVERNSFFFKRHSITKTGH